MCPSRTPDGEERGSIIPIGGAEQKLGDPRILRRFVDLCGGSDADIVVMRNWLPPVRKIPVACSMRSRRAGSSPSARLSKSTDVTRPAPSSENSCS